LVGVFTRHRSGLARAFAADFHYGVFSFVGMLCEIAAFCANRAGVGASSRSFS